MIAALIAVSLAAASEHPGGGCGLAPERQWALLGACSRMTGDGAGPVATAVCVGWRAGFAYLLTANHAVPGGGPRTFTFYTRESYPKPARTETGGEVVLRLEDVDVAVVRLAVLRVPLPAVHLAGPGQRPKRMPFKAVSASCGGDAPPTCREERVAAKVFDRRSPTAEAAFFWDTGRTPAHLTAGGPLVDSELRVIGIRTAPHGDAGRFAHLDEILVGLKRAGYGWLTDPPGTR